MFVQTGIYRGEIARRIAENEPGVGAGHALRCVLVVIGNDLCLSVLRKGPKELSRLVIGPIQ